MLDAQIKNQLCVHFYCLFHELTSEAVPCLLFPEWTSIRKMLELPEELTQNGRSELQQPEEQQVIPVAATAAPLTQVHRQCFRPVADL